MANQMIPQEPNNEKKLVVVSNDLVRAQWKTSSVYECRALNLVAEQIKMTDKSFKPFIVKISDLTGLNHPGGSDLRELKRVLEGCLRKVIYIQDKDGTGACTLFASYHFLKDGTVELNVAPRLRPYLLQLRDKYTSYDSKEFLRLPSIHSQRVYWFLKSCSDRPEVLVEIDELHRILQTPKSLIRNFSMFRQNVLDKAKKDIETFSDIRFDWEPIRQAGSRKFCRIRFVFHKEGVAGGKPLVLHTKTHVKPSATTGNAVLSQKDNLEFIAKLRSKLNGNTVKDSIGNTSKNTKDVLHERAENLFSQHSLPKTDGMRQLVGEEDVIASADAGKKTPVRPAPGRPSGT